MSKRSVICGAVRTPIGRFQGGLASVRAPELGAKCIAALLERTGLDAARVLALGADLAIVEVGHTGERIEDGPAELVKIAYA